MPPAVDEKLLVRLCGIAEELDGCGPGFQDCEPLRAEFNRLADTSLDAGDFAFSEATDAETFVRDVLALRGDLRVEDITRAEFVEMIRCVCEAKGTEHELSYWLELLRVNIPDNRISDLIFWPERYLAAEPNAPEAGDLTPDQILEIALKSGPDNMIHLPDTL